VTICSGLRRWPFAICSAPLSERLSKILSFGVVLKIRSVQ